MGIDAIKKRDNLKKMKMEELGKYRLRVNSRKLSLWLKQMNIK